MKKHWYKQISISLAALLLLGVLPMSAMAEKGMEGKTASSQNGKNPKKPSVW